MANRSEVSIVLGYTSQGKEAAVAGLREVEQAAVQASTKAVGAIDREIAALRRKTAALENESQWRATAARSAEVFLAAERRQIEQNAVSAVETARRRRDVEEANARSIQLLRAQNAEATRREAAAEEEAAARRVAAARRGLAGIAEAARFQREIQLESLAQERRITAERERLAARSTGARDFVSGLVSPAGFGLGSGPLGAGVAAAGVTIFSSRQAMELERAEQAIVAVTGSLIQARAEMGFVQQQAERLGLSVTSTATAWAKFQAASRGTRLEGEQAREIFQSVAEAAQRLNLRTDETEGVLRALEQMISKNKVQAEELRGQLGDRLPGAFNIMARAIGVTTGELDDMLKKGGVIADEVLPKFADELRNTFNTDSQTRIETTAANFTRLWNEIKLTAAELGGLFNLAAGPAAGTLSTNLRFLREYPLIALPRYAAGGLPGVTDYSDYAREFYRQREGVGSGPPLEVLTDPFRSPKREDFYGPGAPLFRAGLTGSALLSSGVVPVDEDNAQKLREQLSAKREITALAQFEAELAAGKYAAESVYEQSLRRQIALQKDKSKAEEEAQRTARAGTRREARDLATQERLYGRELLRADDDALDPLRARLKEEAAAAKRLVKEARDYVDGLLRPEGRRDRREDYRNAPSRSAIDGYAAQDRIDAEQEYTEALVKIEADRLANIEEGVRSQEEVERRAGEARLKADREFARRSIAIELEAASAKRTIAVQQLDAVSGVLEQGAEVAEAFGERGFRVYKALKTAEALVSIPSSAIKAYEATVGIPYIGPALAPVAAGVATAAGFAQLALIQGANYGGGREMGGPVSRDRFYEVNEKGRPELLEEDGKFYLMNAAGNVQPARKLGSAGASGINVQFVNNGPPLAQTAPPQFDGTTLRLFVETAKTAIASDVRRGGLVGRSISRKNNTVVSQDRPRA